jgi:serine/threonine protein kinase
LPSLRDQLCARVACELRYLTHVAISQTYAAIGPEGFLAFAHNRKMLNDTQIAEVARQRNNIRLRCRSCSFAFGEQSLPLSGNFQCPQCSSVINNLFQLTCYWESAQNTARAREAAPRRPPSTLKTWMPRSTPLLDYSNPNKQAISDSGGHAAVHPLTPGYAGPQSGRYPPPTSGRMGAGLSPGSTAQRPGTGRVPQIPNSAYRNGPNIHQSGRQSQAYNTGRVQTPSPPKPSAAPAKKGYQSLINTSLGGFLLEKFLGRGAHGWVFKASHTKAPFPLAVKVVPQAVAQQNPVILKRLEREATILRGVHHENLVRTFGHGKDGGYCFMAMEFIVGGTLGDVMAEWGDKPNIQQGLGLFIQVLKGLGAAHQHGVVHRDLKPDNIMITKENVVKIMDFGLAREDDYDNQGQQGLTIDGEILGTPHYLSPEQANADEIDHRADIYTLGATFYHVFCGSVPFTDKKLVRIIRAHLNKKPQAPRERNPDVPPELEAVLEKMLLKKPEERYQKCEDIITALGPLATVQPIATAAIPEQEEGLKFPEPAFLILIKEGMNESWLSEDRVLKALLVSDKIGRANALFKNSGYVPNDMERRINNARLAQHNEVNQLQARITVENGLLSADVVRQELQQAGETSLAQRLVNIGRLENTVGDKLEAAAKDYHSLIEDMILGKMSVRKQLLSQDQYNELIRTRSLNQRLEDGLKKLNVDHEALEGTKRDTIRYMLKKPLPQLRIPRLQN